MQLKESTQSSSDLVSKLSELDELIDEEKRKWKQQVSDTAHISFSAARLTCMHTSTKMKKMKTYWAAQKNFHRPRMSPMRESSQAIRAIRWVSHRRVLYVAKVNFMVLELCQKSTL